MLTDTSPKGVCRSASQEVRTRFHPLHCPASGRTRTAGWRETIKEAAHRTGPLSSVAFLTLFDPEH